MTSAREAAVSKAKEGITHARSGDILAARRAIAKAASLFPNDAEVQHLSGIANGVCGDWDTALGHFHRALEICPNFHYSKIEIASHYEGRGAFDQARSWYDKAIVSAPLSTRAYILAARMERKRGSHQIARNLLERAWQIDPGGVELTPEIVDVTLWHGERALAAKYLEKSIDLGSADFRIKSRYVMLLNEMADYGKLINFCADLDTSADSSLKTQALMQCGHARLALASARAITVQQAQQREKSIRWQSVTAILARLKSILAMRQPFSLIRLGDGEARILIYFDKAIRKLISEQEADAIGETIWKNWFGESLGHIQLNDLKRLQSAIEDTIAQADVIGLSTANRLMSDNLHFGYLAFLDNYVEQRILSRRTIVTDAFVNNELHRLSPYYRDLLEGLDFVGVIGPHPELGERLADHIGIPKHVTYTVPGEMRLPDRPGMARGIGHFPKRFDELLASITVPRTGAVFLVAAGLLGKVYCNRIKQLGGIALDIGAVADAWAGFNTRPGQHDALWAIPGVVENNPLKQNQDFRFSDKPV